MERVIGRIAGLAVGVIVGLVICIIAFHKMNKNGKVKTEYDERQNEIRGKGYRVGYWAEAIYFVILMILEMVEVNIPAEKMVVYFAGLVVGIVAMCCYCIWNGAYFGLNNDVKKWTIFFVFFTIFNLAIGFMSYIHGTLVVDGIVGAGAINLLCGFMLLIVLIVYLAKGIVDAKENTDEES